MLLLTGARRALQGRMSFLMSRSARGKVDPCPPSASQGPLFDKPDPNAAKPTPDLAAVFAGEAATHLRWLRRHGILVGNNVDAIIRTLDTLASFAKEVARG